MTATKTVQNLKKKVSGLKTADEIISATAKNKSPENKKPTEPPKTEIMVTYQAESGAEISLSPQIVKDFLVSGDGTPTDKEIDNFIKVCQYQRLNPYLREVYLIKWGTANATIVTGKEVFTKRAMRNKEFQGMEAGIVILRGNEIINRKGAILIQGEKLIGGWAKVYKNNYQVPVESSASMTEYCRYKFDGKTPLPTWEKMPSTMIRKVALVQALREAFPEDLGGLYSQEEMPVDISILPQNNPCEENKVTDEIINIAPEYISREEREELFKMVKDDTELLKKIIADCGYENTQTIPKTEYEKICNEVDNAMQSKNNQENQKENISATAGNISSAEGNEANISIKIEESA